MAAGIIKIQMLDFLAQMTTFRVEGGDLGDRTGALDRFGGCSSASSGTSTGSRCCRFGPSRCDLTIGGAVDFDVIVIGSGFGGAITACRLAEAGYTRARPRARPALGQGQLPAQGPRPVDLGPRASGEETGWLDLRVLPAHDGRAGRGASAAAR